MRRIARTGIRLLTESIRWKLVAVVVVLSAGAIAAVTLLAVSRASADQKRAVYDATGQLAAKHASEFEAQVSKHEAIAQTLATSMAGYTSGNRPEVLRQLRLLLDQNPEVAGTYVAYEPDAFPGGDRGHEKTTGADKTGRFVPYWNRLPSNRGHGAIVLDPLLDVDSADYYLLPKRAKRLQIIEPYLYDGSLMTSYIAPILDRNRHFLGIAGDDVILNTIDKDVSRIKVLKTGYAYVVSNGGIFVSAPSKELIGKKTLGQLAKEKGNASLATLAAAVKAGRSGQLETTDPFTGKRVVMFYEAVPSGKWSFVTVAPASEVLASVQRLRTTLLLIGLVALLGIALGVFFLASRLTRPVEALSAVADRIGDGELDVSVDVRSRDETGRMADAFRRMVDYLREMAGVADAIARGDLTSEIRPKSERDVLGNAFATMSSRLSGMISEVADTALGMSSASQQMATTSDEAGRAVGEIASAIGSVAIGAERQTRMVEQARVSIEETGAAAGRATDLARQGAETAEQASEAMDTLRASSSEVVEAIRELARRSGEIGGIVETISGIAGQTNLLALNAAIEAARAGEQGRGFAVVAEEVRKLAEEARQAAVSIGALIDEIQGETEKTVWIVEEGARRTDESTATVQAAREAFEQIGAAVEAMRERIGQIVDATNEVAVVAEQSSASTEEVSASAQETSASAQEIAASAQGLATTASALEQLVSRFRVASG